MPRIRTRDFGSLDYSPEAIVEFPRGLPGFESHKRFVLIEQPALKPIVAIQSMDSTELCFLAVPVSFVDTAYQTGITDEDLELLDLTPGQQPDPSTQVACLAILSAREFSGNDDEGRGAGERGEGKGGDPVLTANLLAPIIINPVTRRAVQAVRADALYSHEHPLPNLPWGAEGCS